MPFLVINRNNPIYGEKTPRHDADSNKKSELSFFKRIKLALSLYKRCDGEKLKKSDDLRSPSYKKAQHSRLKNAIFTTHFVKNFLGNTKKGSSKIGLNKAFTQATANSWEAQNGDYFRYLKKRQENSGAPSKSTKESSESKPNTKPFKVTHGSLAALITSMILKK